jgi:hypothetical protein
LIRAGETPEPESPPRRMNPGTMDAPFGQA